MKNVRKMTKSARSVTYSPDGRALAIGFKDGKSDCRLNWKKIVPHQSVCNRTTFDYRLVPRVRKEEF